MYGLEMFSDDGKLFFSADNLCYRLYEKQILTILGPGTTDYNQINQYYFETTITSSSGHPILFVKPTGTTSGLGGTTIDGAISVSVKKLNATDYKYTIFTRDTVNLGGGPLTCYVFLPGCLEATGYGVNVYTSNGTVSFSTRDRLLKISAYYIFPYQTTNAHPENLSPTLLSYGSIPTSYALGVGNAGWSILTFATFGSVFGIGSYIRSDQKLGHSLCFNISQIGPVGDVSTATGDQYVPIIDTSLYD